jgi:hypothetical protein
MCIVSGADVTLGSCSYPFRGQKGTLWEGEVKGVGLISGLDLVTSPLAGGMSDELYHIRYLIGTPLCSDWLASQ